MTVEKLTFGLSLAITQRSLSQYSYASTSVMDESCTSFHNFSLTKLKLAVKSLDYVSIC